MVIYIRETLGETNIHWLNDTDLVWKKFLNGVILKGNKVTLKLKNDLNFSDSFKNQKHKELI